MLYLTDGHHTFTALENSAYGSSNPNVYVNVIANYSNLTTAQFWAQMQAANLLLPLNDGVPQVVNTATGSPIPTTLTGLTSDVYRGLEYSILKNKNSKLFTTTSNIAGVRVRRYRASTKKLACMPILSTPTPTGTPMAALDCPTSPRATFRLRHNGISIPPASPPMPNVGTVTVAQLPGLHPGKEPHRHQHRRHDQQLDAGDRDARWQRRLYRHHPIQSGHTEQSDHGRHTAGRLRHAARQ